jgi:hypothetical protein
MDQIESENSRRRRSGQNRNPATFRGGAIAGEHGNSIPSTIQRTENIGIEWGIWRAHQGRKRRWSRTENDVEFGMADGGGVVGLLARGGVLGARMTLRKGWMEAVVRGTWLI